MIFALGIDAGPDRTGISSVMLDGRRFVLCASDHVLYGGGYSFEGQALPWAGEQLERYLEDAASVGATVAIETIRGRVYPGRAPEHLFETRTTEGMILRACRTLGIVPELWRAGTWRRYLTGQHAPSDQQIELVVRGLVHGIPKDLPYRKASHMFDSAGLAVFVLSRAAGIVYPRDLPASAVGALMRQQQEDSARRALKKIRKENGGWWAILDGNGPGSPGPRETPDKRHPTRLQRAARKAARA